MVPYLTFLNHFKRSVENNGFQGGGSDVVSVSCFGVRFSVMFHFMFFSFYF